MEMPVACRNLLVAGLLALALSPALAIAQDRPGGVGVQPISVHDPVGGGEMPGFVFYPSATASATTWRGPYELHATPGAKPIPGAKPLVVV